MKQSLSIRLCALFLTLCLCLMPAASTAETWLPDGEVTHTDFTLSLALHADGFPASAAHLSDWETFLSKLSLRGSMDSLAMFTPTSRVYLDGNLQLNGEDQLPFTYDGYYTYRYLLSPALGDSVLYFQMYNFLEFMLKPYYYMELPTQYLALLMYPDAAYWLGDSYYTPVKEMMEQAHVDAVEEADADTQTADDGAITIIGGADGPTEIYLSDSADDTLTYTIPYEDLYELCETLNLIVNDDYDLGRAYFFFTCLLTDLYASDMTLEILGNLDAELDALDPEQNGMTVTETPDGMTCVIGDTVVYERTNEGDATAFTLTLPTAEGYTLTFDYHWTPAQDRGAALSASLCLMTDGETSLLVTAEGEGLPRTGELSGEGSLTLGASGAMLDSDPDDQTFAFSWNRDAAQKPYTLDVSLSWLHPQTLRPALTLAFNGTLSTVDKSVFVDGTYPQDDFFSLNETFLEDYKDALLKPMILKMVPFLLETPGGVIDDIYRFTSDTGILVSFVE